MDDDQLLALIGNVRELSDRLAREGRFVDAAVVAGAYQAIRALRTRLEPPEAPALKSVPNEVG